MKEFGSAVIIAGGKSSRMGFDKQKLSIKRNRLINQIIKTLNSKFDEIIVVTNTPTFYTDLPCVTIKDIIPDMGPLSGIHAGLKYASSKYVYVIACDMPVISLDYIEYMMEGLKGKKYDGCITRFGNWIEPFNAFYGNKTADYFEDYLASGKRSVFKAIEALDCLYIEESDGRRFSPEWEMFDNLNTREDIKRFTRKKPADF